MSDPKIGNPLGPASPNNTPPKPATRGTTYTPPQPARTGDAPYRPTAPLTNTPKKGGSR